MNPKVKQGDRFTDAIGPIRCMAVVEGWVVCRRPRAVPFVLSAREWDDRAAQAGGAK